ncbi:DUF2089 domain-containing protein [Acidaminobacter sp. JC074]|uniref:DUF2089 domain-containing protein n=1 Tax=Acidaminobacter sp. JC074 TaxID=2530199 RepID=UPI001F0CFC51|nr:DUF2089 domain-containing protein [Acidaminobacter sp. JC074]MCH4889141.1 DUF2089 domain-containing protein [Acidaminobacter sp. JC074]
MKRNVLGTCPVCSSHLDVTELHCPDCHTSIKGEFKLDKFNYLSKEEKYFIEIFVKNRGNIKEIEKDLGISYPTVKKNLEQVIEALGYGQQAEEKKLSKEEILEKLSNGEMTSEEAMRMIKDL